MNKSPNNNLEIKSIKSDSTCITAILPKNIKYPIKILPLLNSMESFS